MAMISQKLPGRLGFNSHVGGLNGVEIEIMNLQNFVLV